MPSQLDYVTTRMTRYFAAVDAIFQQNQPPATNAANGWIRGYMIAPHMSAYGNGPSMQLDGQARELLQCFIAFHAGTHQAFQTCENVYANLKHPRVLMAHADIFIKAIEVISDIIVIITADDKAKEEAQKELQEDIAALTNSLRNKGVTSKGYHASGWIATYIKSTASQTLSTLQSNFNGEPNSDAHIVAELFKRMCRNLIDLPTHHSPWLSPEWQLRYHAIMKTGLQGLTINQDFD